jgi:transposase
MPKERAVSEKRRPRRKFTAEQKAEAVRLVRETGSICQVARDLDLTASALRSWVRQAEIDAGTGPSGEFTSAEKEELRRLRRENRVLQQERDFLKKAAVGSDDRRNTTRGVVVLAHQVDTWHDLVDRASPRLAGRKSGSVGGTGSL